MTNPAIDPLRETMVMSVQGTLGAEKNLFHETPEQCQQIKLESPCLSDEQFVKIQNLKDCPIRSVTISTLFQVSSGAGGLEKAIQQLRKSVTESIDSGVQIIILSDRGSNKTQVPIPSLLAVSAVHHHLIRNGKRMKAGLVIDSGEPREIMHYCLLAGYGATAWHPYLAYETVRQMVQNGWIKNIGETQALENYRKSVDKGIQKVATKMGISTQQSYRGAQIFEAVGLSQPFIDEYFTWTPSRIQGVGLETIAQEMLQKHDQAYRIDPQLSGTLEVGGRYQWRRRGERHILNPDTVEKLQYAVRKNDTKSFTEHSKFLNEQNDKLLTLRGLLHFKKTDSIPIEEVESAKEIVKRFATGAMSLGSISRESHETLAIAMNRIEAKSNTGEGGEDPARYTRDANGDLRRSSIKQVASGRFGVTIGYLSNADDIQIKIAHRSQTGRRRTITGP